MDERRREEIEAAAEYASHRYELYKARTYGPRPTSPARLSELKRDADRAKLALHRVQSDA